MAGLRFAWVIAAVLATVPGLAAARCEGVAPGAKPQNTFAEDVGQTLDTIIERGFVEFAVYDDFPPYSWEEAGAPRGVDVAVGALIAEALEVEPRFRFVQAGENLDADLLNNVWKGAAVDGHVVNVMLRVPYDSDYACRIEQVVFTGQYAGEGVAIAYDRAAYPDGGPKPAYFRYDTVAVENDSIADFYLTSLLGAEASANVHRFPTMAEAMAALDRGEVMAAMGQQGLIEAGVTGRIAVHAPPLVGFARSRWTVGVAVHQSHRDLAYAVDDAIAAGLADGRIPAIYADYGLTFTEPER